MTITINWKWITILLLSAIIIYLAKISKDGWAMIFTLPAIIVCVLLIVIVALLPF